MFEFAPLIQHAVELSGVTGRAPRICHIGTAGGDQQWFNALFSEAGEAAGMTMTHLNLFPMPSVADPAATAARAGRGLGRRRQRGEPAGGVAAARAGQGRCARSGRPAWC